MCGISRNTGGTHDTWAYMRGCLSHLDSAPKCIGSLLLEDPLNARGKSLIPTVATLLTELSPEKQARAVVQGRVGSRYDVIQQWCHVKAWVGSSPTCDFWVVDEAKYRWGLPVLVPTCPRKLFKQGPRLKYVDVVTDTLHASSSDLITWNTLVLVKLRWFTEIPRQWLAIATHSLEAWKARDQLSQFRSDNRRGYARVTPMALSHIGVPGSNILHADDYPTEGLGVYDDFEVCNNFTGYIWATWTTMAAQPMQIDSALQALLNSSGGPVGQPGVRYDLGVPINVNAADQPMGSNECASGVATPFPDSVEDVSMESGADKRSRESPDSTLKPEGKSLKISETTTASTTMDSDEKPTSVSTKPASMTRRPKTISEAKSLMRAVHERMPSWKAEKLLESCEARMDLATLGDATGIFFESHDMLKAAVLHLERIRIGRAEEENADLDASEASDTHSSKPKDEGESENTRSDDQKTENAKPTPAGDALATPCATGVGKGISNQGQGSSSKAPEDTSGQQKDVESKTGSVHEEKQRPAAESHEDWFGRVTKGGQEVLWPLKGSGRCPTLLTGVQSSDLKSLETFRWEEKLETADLEKHTDYLRGRHFVALPHPLEATAWENGFVPETHGLPSEELKPRMLPLLPQLSHMVSAPRQTVTAGRALLTRFDLESNLRRL